MNPTVISDESGQKTEARMSPGTIAWVSIALIVLVIDVYPPALFGLAPIALVYVARRKVRIPTPMHRVTNYLKQNITMLQMKPNALFEDLPSPMDPLRDFTLTFQGDCDLAHVRALLKVLFETKFKCDIVPIRHGNFKARFQKRPTHGYVVLVREHDELPGHFRVHVERDIM